MGERGVEENLFRKYVKTVICTTLIKHFFFAKTSMDTSDSNDIFKVFWALCVLVL